MKIIRSECKLSLTWYSKPTGTGLTMNYHALTPIRYKRTVVSNLVHRIFNACSSWTNIHKSLAKAKKILERNQYPAKFYDAIIKDTITKIFEKEKGTQSGEEKKNEEGVKPTLFFVQYRGNVTDKFDKSLKKINAPCKLVKKLKKTKHVLPSLKAKVEKELKSMVVYQIQCPRCESSYVGQTARHLITRIKEHRNVNTPVGSHFQNCDCEILMENVTIIDRTIKSEQCLMSLEALWINKLKPNNTKQYL